MGRASTVSTNVGVKSTKRERQPTFVESIAANVRAAAKAQGLMTSKALSDALDLATSSGDNYWKGQRPWPTEMIPQLVTLLETSADQLLGVSATTDGDRAGRDLVAIEEIDLAYGMGSTFADADVTIQTEIVRFERGWLEGITSTPPALLTFARGRGDSMQPTLQDGDIVLIDRSVRTIREWDAVWALTIGDMAMIKRVRVKGETVTILSDNERVPAENVHHEEVNVVGRVIFIGRKI